MTDQTKPGFTSGPWEPHGKGWEVRAADGQMKICDIRGWGHLTGKGALALPHAQAVEIQVANARLIAAAPSLYEALENIVAAYDWWQVDPVDRESPHDEIEAARTALQLTKTGEV